MIKENTVPGRWWRVTTNSVQTSNAVAVACLSQNKVRFLLDIMLIFLRTTIEWRPTSIKWPLVSIPRVTVRLRVNHHWRYFCFQKIPRFFNTPAKTALSDQNGAECLGQYRHPGSSSLKLRTIVDKSVGTTLHRLRVVPHFSSGRVERAKRERFAHSTIPEGKWGTTRSLNFAFLGRFPIHTSPTPPLTPQTMLDACIQNFFRI